MLQYDIICHAQHIPAYPTDRHKDWPVSIQMSLSLNPDEPQLDSDSEAASGWARLATARLEGSGTL